MAHFLPAAIMFLVTVLTTTVLILPIRRVRPTNSVARVYWRGLWVLLVAIASVAGAMNTLTLAGMNVVGPTEALLNVLLPGLVVFVVVGWFHMVGMGLAKGANRIARKARA